MNQTFPEAGPSHEAVTGALWSVARTPIEDLVSSIDPEAAADFMGCVRAVNEVINKEKPEIVFIPQRGAAPLRWAIEALRGSQAPSDLTVEPIFIDLPIGTYRDLPSKSVNGPTKSLKAKIIRETLTELEGQGLYVPNETSIMLIDEVQNGGTISTAVNALQKAMKYDYSDSTTISVVAVQDSRGKLIGNVKAQSYKQIATNRRERV